MIAKPAESHQPTILLVEDDEPTRDAMTTILVHEGYFVLGAATGHDALGLVRTPLTPIDVVLLDVHLPDVSGIDVCARLKESHPHLPIVVCSGEGEPEEIAELVKLGIHRYFRKPMALDELLAAVEASLAFDGPSGGAET
jgi:DNA-binding response OmpR family regulator